MLADPNAANQWFAPAAREAINKIALQENEKFPHSIEFYIDAIELSWLNMAVPAGNA